MNVFRKIFFVFFSAFFLSAASAQTLNDDAQISLITCGSGNELYSTFGHSAIRVCDTAQNLDIVFNYGTFDFNTPNFYAKFATGTLMYVLSVDDFSRFLYSYKRENRSVYEQKLNLNSEQKQKLFALLVENYQPQNREYRYDFFKDNCSTRIRDIFQKAVPQLQFLKRHSENNKTFRQLICPYLEKMPWTKFGIDILLGMPTDKRATDADYMFLPDELLLNTAQAKINEIPFADDTKTLYLARDTEQSKLPNPNIVFFSLLTIIAILTFLEWRKKINLKVFDRVFFLSLSLLSLLIILMWIFSLHYPVRGNLNVLWLNPLYFYVFWKLERSNFWILFVCLVCNIAVLCFHWILPQHFNTAFFAIVLIAIFRLLILISKRKKILN